MALPDLPGLHEILGQLRLSPEGPSSLSAAIQIPFLPATDESGKHLQEPALWLHYPVQTTITFKGLIERINKELNATGHRKHDDFALLVLAIAILMPPIHGQATARLNGIVGGVCDADANLVYVQKISLPEYYKFTIPPFTLGPLNTEKLRYSCEKAASDYYSRYQRELKGAWAIERAPMNVRILDITQIRELVFDQRSTPRQPWEMRAWESIVNGYFSLQNRVLFENFWLELISVQGPLLAMGAPFFDPRPLASILKATCIAVFLNIGRDKKGFVAPAGVGTYSIDLASAHKRIPNALEELRQLYKFRAFDDTPLHQSIRLFSDFVARAHLHGAPCRRWRERMRHRYSEAQNRAALEPVRIQQVCRKVFRTLDSRVAPLACRPAKPFRRRVH